ncbi:MAG: glycosyltransferase [Microbacterium sp.]
MIAQPGRRDDDAHELGYRSATTIIAPWPRALLKPGHLAAMKEKTVFTGGISRFEGRMEAPRLPVEARGPDVVLLGGRGGSGVSAATIAEATTSSGHRWRVLGATPDDSWSADPWTDLISARVVVSWAGQNSIADVAAAGAAAVIVPQERPFYEQRETARAVKSAGLAIVATQWPAADAWPELINRAARLRPDWSGWKVKGAAARAAAAIDETGRGVRR